MIASEAEYLEAAADYIERHGWIQFFMFSKDGVCLFGGIRGVRHLCRSEAEGLTLEALAVERLCKRINGFAALAVWNDVRGRTKQQVLDLLRDSAKDARREEEGKCSAGRFLLARSVIRG